MASTPTNGAEPVPSPPHSRLGAALFATTASRIWGAGLSLVAVPLYVHFLGVEAYGVVGLYTTIIMLVGFMDLGLSIGLTQELATAEGDGSRRFSAGTVTRTYEVTYVGIAIGLGLALALSSPYLARDWITSETLPIATIQRALWLGVLAIVLQWPSTLYSAGLNGLRHQVLVGLANGAFTTLRVCTTVVCLWISPSLESFFTAQCLASASQTLFLRSALWRRILPDHTGRSPAFSKAFLASSWRFAGGMTGVMITGTLLTQADKIVLSKLVPLTEFGYYAVASTLATGLLVLITPIFTTFYPRFAAKARSDDCSEAAGLFHLGCQIMAAAALPAAATVAAFPEQILQLWTRDALISGNASSILAFLVIGNALNGLMTLPYAMQVAKGWTSLPIVFNLFALLVLIPGVYNAALLYGIAGGGVAWAALNLGYVLITPHIMHRRLLPGEKRRWYLFSVFVPVLVSATIACVAMLLFRAWQSAAGRPGDLAVLAMMLLCWATISIAIVSCMPDLRSVLLRLYAARVAP